MESANLRQKDFAPRSVWQGLWSEQDQARVNLDPQYTVDLTSHLKCVRDQIQPQAHVPQYFIQSLSFLWEKKKRA